MRRSHIENFLKSNYYVRAAWPKRAAAEASYKSAMAAFDALTTPAKGKRSSPGGADGEPAAKKVTLNVNDIESVLVVIDGEQYVSDTSGHLRKLVGGVFKDSDAVRAHRVASIISTARAAGRKRARAAAAAAGTGGETSEGGSASPRRTSGAAASDDK